MKTVRLSRVTGFSLIELLIVVLILSILAAIALPSYRQYVLRGHRAEATKVLQDLAGREENYFYVNNGYTSTLSALGTTTTNLQQTAPDYDITISVDSTAANYSLLATATGTQAQDTACASLALTNTGLYTSNGSTTVDSNNCWQSH